MATQHPSQSASLVPESAIIHLIKQLLTDEPSRKGMHDRPSRDALENSVDEARQDAGCVLWDMAAVQEHADVMAVSLQQNMSGLEL